MTESTQDKTKSRPLTAAQRRIVDSLADSDCEDLLQKTSHLPTNVYASQSRFELEQRKLFRGRPVPIEVSAALPKPKMHIVNNDYGLSVMLTRDLEGAAHAFVNVCRHRCVQLSQAHEAKAGALVSCPYHAWSYDLKGNLIAVPREEVFPGLDKSQHGLLPLECREAGGLIWVNLEREARADFSIIRELAQDFNAIGLPEQVLYRKKRFDLATNWKLVHDAFLENYHVSRLHAKSLGMMFKDRPTVCERIGPHLLQSSARIGYKRADRVHIKTYDDFRKMGVFSYTILPGGIVITSPTYINVMLLAPQAPERTIVNYYMLVDHAPESEAEKERYERSISLMERVTEEEDFWVAQLGTIGARTGVMPEMVLGGMEQDIARFHQTINEALKD